MENIQKKSNLINKVVFLFLGGLILVLIAILIGKNFNPQSLIPKIISFQINSINQGNALEVKLEAADKLGLRELVLQTKGQKVVTDCQGQKRCFRNLIINKLSPTPSGFITLIVRVINLNNEQISTQRVVEIKQSQMKTCEQPLDCGEISDCGEIWLCLEGVCQSEFRSCTATDEVTNSTSTPELY